MIRTIKRTYRILLTALLGAAAVSSSTSAESVLLRARALVDSGFAAPAVTVESVRPEARPAVDVASFLEGTGAIEGSSHCGAENQRPCRVDERIPSCNDDLYEDFSEDLCRHLPCGREGQRACTSFERPLNSCDNDLVEIPGCTDCQGATGMCIRPTDCGGEGQRACCVGEQSAACGDNLIEIPGCSGDCFCGLDGGRASSSTCAPSPLPSMSEPMLGGIAAPAACSLKGYADMHMHLFADMAHGGAILAGKPAGYVCTKDANGVETCTDHGIASALAPDYGSNLTLVTKGDATTGEPVDPPSCPSFLPNCGARLFHGDHTIFDDPVGAFGTGDGSTSNLGAPLFNGWPRWTSTTHQQVYYKWLERAWRGGLRLITQLAVTNEALCRGGKRVLGVDCSDSMAAIDKQIEEAYRFEDFIDRQYGQDDEVNGIEVDRGWFRIVKTPLEARKAIATGKLAVVLGIEVDNLFNCKFPMDQCTVYGEKGDFLSSCNFEPETTTCTAQNVRDKVQHYYDLGIRHVFPIHNFDNAFGGPATWQDAIEVGNRVVENHWWSTVKCQAQPQGKYGFALGSFTQIVVSILKFWPQTITEVPGRSDDDPDCNSMSLLPLGTVLLDKMMELGMIIDVDHMSNKAFDATLTQAEGHFPTYPVVASHVLSFDRHDEESRHERMRTRAQLERIKGVGGMIAAMLKDEVQDQLTWPIGRKGEKHQLDYASSSVLNDCRHSSKSFAQAYEYAVDVMGGPVALGSDFNGVAGHIGPRFGSDACGGLIELFSPPERMTERAKQYVTGKLEYPFVLSGFGTFGRQVTGLKVFDYNKDGMAHVGLLPDFVADLRKVGMRDQHLNQLMGSAEGYIKTWERATAASPSTEDNTPAAAVADTCAFLINPSISVPEDIVVEATSAAGASVTFTVTASDPEDGPLTPVCTAASGATFALGHTTVTCQATDSAGNRATDASFDIFVRDTIAPAIVASVSPDANASGWHRDPVAIHWTLTDAVGVTEFTGCTDRTIVDDGQVIIVCTARDAAGNIGNDSVTVKLDRTAPAISFGTLSPPPNENGWQRTDVSLPYTITEAGSGLPAGSPSAGTLTFGNEGEGLTQTVTATDVAGNQTIATSPAVNLDKTAPTIAGALDRAPNGNTWYNADVVVSFTCTDALAGVGACGPTPQIVSEEGGNLSRTASATDRAGNTASATVGGIYVDKTAPTVSCSNTAPALWPPNHRMVPVQATIGIDDGVSGVGALTLVSATSNEPDNGLGDGDTANDIQGFTIGTAGTSGFFRAERSGRGTGRIYSLVYQALDLAGNAATCTTTAAVVTPGQASKK